MVQRILLVEESRPLATALKEQVETAGFAVDVARAADAPASITADHVVALVRGGTLGEAVMAVLRKAEPDLPVAMLFADAQEAEKSKVRPDAVFVGPLSTPAVGAAFRTLGKLREQARELARLEKAAPRSPGSADVHDLEFLKKLLLMEVKRSRRYRYPISLALIAVDRWREASKPLEGKARVQLLGELLGVLTSAVRDIDLALLYSEERFLVFMPHTRAEGALKVARRLSMRVREHPGAVPVTASVGVATFEGEGTVSFSSLIRDASEALGRAQADGGDRAEQAGTVQRRRDRVVLG
jgi:two-component system, cell cycle response regulator